MKKLITTTFYGMLIFQLYAQSKADIASSLQLSVKTETHNLLWAIGVGHPKKMDTLHNAAFDAFDMAEKFKGMRFAVKLSIDPESNEFSRILDSLSLQMKNVSIFVLYISSHGMAVNDEPYFLASDADIFSAKDLLATAFSLTTIVNRLSKWYPVKIIVIFDACRLGPPATVMNKFSTRRKIDTLANHDVVYAYASAPQAGSLGCDTVRNSYFTASMLKHIDEPRYFYQICTKVSSEVRKNTKDLKKGPQVPVIVNYIAEDILLVDSSNKKYLSDVDSLSSKPYHGSISKKLFLHKSVS